MQEICKYMQKYADGNMHEYAKNATENMQKICKYMQNMQ